MQWMRTVFHQPFVGRRTAGRISTKVENKEKETKLALTNETDKNRTILDTETSGTTDQLEHETNRTAI